MDSLSFFNPEAAARREAQTHLAQSEVLATICSGCSPVLREVDMFDGMEEPAEGTL